ncbi:hypothetical protein ACFL1T_02165 [Chlamydiota bacterium]
MVLSGGKNQPNEDLSQNKDIRPSKQFVFLPEEAQNVIRHDESEYYLKKREVTLAIVSSLKKYLKSCFLVYI